MNNNKIIVTFGGIAQSFMYITPAEFKTFTTEKFSNIPVLFFSDSERHWYQNGMDIWNEESSQWDRISTNIDESIEYLANILKNYNNIYFVGVSSGGYAAILHAHLLNISNLGIKVNKVLTYVPQTDISKSFSAPIEQELDRDTFDLRYLDLSKLPIGDLEIIIHGDDLSQIESSLHHIRHCTNMANFSNVSIINHTNLHMKTYRDDGFLFDDFTALIS